MDRGVTLETVAPGLADEDLVSLGRSLGRLLASIHGIAFERAGFLDARLAVAEPIDLGLEGLRGFLHRCLVEGVGGERLGSQLTAALLTYVERQGSRLEAWLGRPCLTHADFNGSNILVRRVGAAWEVAAVLDWEFAFSGTPAVDFGNLLRPPWDNATNSPPLSPPPISGPGAGCRRIGKPSPDSPISMPGRISSAGPPPARP